MLEKGIPVGLFKTHFALIAINTKLTANLIISQSRISCLVFARQDQQQKHHPGQTQTAIHQTSQR